MTASTTYEVRTARDTPVYSYDSLERARQGKREAEARVKVPMRLVEVVRTEREIEG